MKRKKTLIKPALTTDNIGVLLGAGITNLRFKQALGLMSGA
jgi:hypothetical protein